MEKKKRIPTLFCDNDKCGDLVVAAKTIKVTFPDGEKLERNLCLDCYPHREEIKKKIAKDPRKNQVARVLRILKGDQKK